VRLDAEPPEALGLQLLREDPVGATLADADAAGLVRMALADGTGVGAELRAAYPGQAPTAIATTLGIAVRHTEESPWCGPFLRWADYRPCPPEIRLFERALRNLSGLLADPASIFVAHELYHHIEGRRLLLPLPRRYARVRFRIGKIRLSVQVAALSEIAAGGCAQALLGLGWHPAVLCRLAREAASWRLPAPA
jgi:hypothetical protein